MTRAMTIFRKVRAAVADLNLLKALQSEIAHEKSNPLQVKGEKTGSLGDFALDYDSLGSQDVVLQKKCESGEEIAISALLGPESWEEDSTFNRYVLMKVCVKKPGLSSLMQFDCGVYEKGAHGSKFDIHNANYLPSATCPSSSAYKGPLFRTLDPKLQKELEQYLVVRGIGESLTNFLLFHLHKKEQAQYENWLQKIESFVAKGKSD